MNSKSVIYVVFVILSAFSALVNGAARQYNVTWDSTLRIFYLDGTRTPEIQLSIGDTYLFHIVASTNSPKFFISFEDDNTTVSALGTAEGVSTPNICSGCDISYTPREADIIEDIWYCAENHVGAGNKIILTKCSTKTTSTECGEVIGCGWRENACVLCQGITTSSDCISTIGCGWCEDTSTGICTTETETTCELFQSSGANNKTTVPFWGWIILGVGVFGIAVAVAITSFVLVRKHKAKKQNENMFRVEDQMSVLGGRTTDDFTL